VAGPATGPGRFVAHFRIVANSRRGHRKGQPTGTGSAAVCLIALALKRALTISKQSEERQGEQPRLFDRPDRHRSGNSVVLGLS
jgi:hypothetical protein